MFLRKTSGAAIFAAALLAAFLLFAACEQSAGVVRDDDATLRTLTVDRGTLSPAFSASRFQYRVAVRNANDAITVTAAANSDRATVSGAGTKTLNVGGNNIITVNVKAENGVSKTYTITVTRASVKEIATAQDMAKIGVDEDWSLAGDYILVNNITLVNWRGIASENGEIFSGGFDGGGKTITLNGLALSGNSVSIPGVSPLAGSNPLAGVFCRVEGSPGLRAEIKNLTVVVNALIDEDPQSHMSVGVVAGYAKETNFENITIKGNISARNAYTTGSRPGNRRLYLGGIAGSVEASSITECRNEAAIYGFGWAYSAVYNQIGGIAGMFYNNVNIQNCHNTGNIAGETTGSASNVFVGGIAGGSFYYTNTNYRGVIEDCSSTGDIHAEGAAFWSWAGGIAGVVVGSGTKVVRSRASGAISVNGPAGSWPYVGGITGYNYYGSVIEQCYFTGEVEVQGGNVVSDYAGGISGYNSQYKNPSTGELFSSIIQDCWSSGSVTGFLNAGGIVGQNQVYTNLRRCYSTAQIIVTAPPDARANLANSGAGGIAGFSVSTEEDGVTANVALNASISAPNGFPVLGRVVGTNSATYVAGGYKDEGGNIRNNYAGSGMSATIAGGPKQISADINGIDGANCADKPDQTFYVSLGWNFTDVWKMGANGYPQLKWQQ